jgi:hypothetical protein
VKPPTNPSTDPNNPLTWPEYQPGGSQKPTPPPDQTPPDDLPWFLLTPPQFFIATLLALALVAVTPQQLAPATVLIPYGTPFRSKSPEEVYGPLPTTAPPQTQPGDGGVPQALPGGGSGGNRPPNRPPTAPPPDFPGSTDPKVRVSQKGLDMVKAHLSRPNFTDPYTGELGTEYPPNAAMIQRLEEALNQGNTLSGADANFYFHELYESTLMDRGLSYDEAHEQALNRYGVSRLAIYHPDVIQALPRFFSPAWFDFWGILP